MEIIDCGQGKYFWYQVKKHDTISSIQQQFGVNSSAIKRNNYNTDLYEGEVVKIINKSNTLHIVKPMENLQTIAKIYNTSIEKLAKINNLTSNRLFIGQTLIVNSDKT